MKGSGSIETGGRGTAPARSDGEKGKGKGMRMGMRMGKGMRMGMRMREGMRMPMRMRATSRMLVALAALLLVPVFFLPLWSIRLVAPQYREGLGMFIGLGDIRGHNPHDIQNINILNHYIGMKPIVPAEVDVLAVMPWVVVGLLVAGLAAALIGRRLLVALWLVAFLGLGTAGLVEFRSWNHDYGHNLSPDAPIKVPGMTYQPPLIGAKQLLNIRATSYPSWGTLALGLSFLLAALALVNERRRPARPGRGGEGVAPPLGGDADARREAPRDPHPEAPRDPHPEAPRDPHPEAPRDPHPEAPRDPRPRPRGDRRQRLAPAVMAVLLPVAALLSLAGCGEPEGGIGDARAGAGSGAAIGASAGAGAGASAGAGAGARAATRAGAGANAEVPRWASGGVPSDYCDGVIPEERFGAQIDTRDGSVYRFMSVECLAGFLLEQRVAPPAIRSIRVVDYNHGERLIDLDDALFVRSQFRPSPNGLNLLATDSEKIAANLHRFFGGERLDWEGVLALVAREWGLGDHAPAEQVGGRILSWPEVEAGARHGEHVAAHAPASAPSAAASRELLVGAGQPFTALGAALARAQDGDRIRVLAGTYAESGLEVDRSVVLIGEGWPVLDGAGARGNVLRVTADDVTVRGFVIRGVPVSHVRDNAAVLFEGVRGCVAEGNRLEDNHFGIYVARSSSCIIRGNRIEASGTREVNAGNGIHLWNVDDVVVEDNRVQGHRDGVYLEFARATELRGNVSQRNLRYGLHFMFSDDAVYEDNLFRDNGAGVAVMYSKRVRMAGNTFADNQGQAAYGLLVKEITDSEVTGNRFERNTVGVYSEGSARIEFRGNRFVGNGWAVRIMANSQGNRFADNDFIDNSFDVTTNSRQNPNTFTGNYWNRYRGYDLTGDGFGDVPHRPVRLFALIVEKNPVALMLLRAAFVDALDLAERVVPALTPETLVDERPRMSELNRNGTRSP